MKIQESNIKSYGTLLLGTILTLAISGFSGAAIGGSVGMSQALYGAIIGGAIGCCVACYKTDISIELSAVIGAALGTMLGIVYAKGKESKNEELGIDNSDYLKGLNCTKKAVLSHAKDTINCVSGDFFSCEKLLQGQAEIMTCMGNDSINEGMIT